MVIALYGDFDLSYGFYIYMKKRGLSKLSIIAG